ncbi:MAG TPA: hypothetical protein DEG17_22050 [Cyanobacteria bacterium UBA11149]|nr:hypothetical protein [Cyanobacteria bacterium UBA11367]HBE57827.1 hypothetical protein [Cyanobacteria bacterium UBA11366]HBK66095.1 hypothetical protein [Cyanobacteria bacterium UBA11166]HBR73505.1 hypothetical protein [Cyanobacteria bacterium UBA11159]HBS68959.1 hypothetical protein [Cyanobacteria bacterium UBA11153]HBW91465.1 hypothetical protein [Cyanobacteria bacterium UBA11149]HCA96827.1 hypothetical protein [Cyanobacteria bacterium UBA9226]
MTTEDSKIKQPAKGKLTYRFLGGAALGTFAPLILISYALPIDWNSVTIGATLLFAICCGLLSSIWGKNFIDAAIRVLNSFGF